MPDSIVIREGRPDDWRVIAEGNMAMARETEGKELVAGIVESGVRAALADGHKGRYLLVERDGRVVGQAMVTLEWSDWRNGWLWWIQSVFVLPACRRCGVFRRLYHHIREQARAEGDVCGLRLYVERANDRAVATYAALGMTDAGYELMEEEWSAKRG